MFCKNCGREIDQKTLKKLMEKKDGSVVCSKCQQPLDNAEMCGGFWGLIAASEEKEAAEADTVNMTVMLDENGKPVQMNPRMQNRSASSIPDANLRMSANDFSSQNSRQTSGPVMYDSAPYEQKAPETRIRRSGARKDTELWITRAIALLLGIALIISLVTRCGKSDQPQDEMEEPIKTAEDMQDDFDYTEVPSNESGNAQGAPDEEPEDTAEEEEQKAVEAEETEDKDIPANADTGDTEEENIEEPAAAVQTQKPSYQELKRTIELDKNKLNFQSGVEIIVEGGKNASIGWYYKNDDGSSGDQKISTTKHYKNRKVEERYESEETGAPKVRVSYTYKDDYLKSAVRYPEDGKNDSVSYVTLPDFKVREKHSQSQRGIKPDGSPFDYTIVDKTYDKKTNADGSESASNKLKMIEYYEDEGDIEDKAPVLQIYYTISDSYPEEEYSSDPGVYTKAERYSYSEGGESVIMTGPENEYEYDEIRYTYANVDGGDEPRLREMGYYFQGERTEGPNGFSYFKCEYEGSVRTDSFCDPNGGPVTITAEDPFLSEAVIPAFYSEEFPFLTGRPVPAGVSSEDETTETDGRAKKQKAGQKNHNPQSQYPDSYSDPAE